MQLFTQISVAVIGVTCGVLGAFFIIKHLLPKIAQKRRTQEKYSLKLDEISLVDFEHDFNRMLKAVIECGLTTMEARDLGDFIGRCLMSKTELEQELLFEELCSGIQHGIGIGHQHFNDRCSIETIVESWQRDEQSNRAVDE